MFRYRVGTSTSNVRNRSRDPTDIHLSGCIDTEQYDFKLIIYIKFYNKIQLFTAYTPFNTIIPYTAIPVLSMLNLIPMYDTSRRDWHTTFDYNVHVA